MKIDRRRFVSLAAAAAVVPLTAARAQTAARPLTLVIPFAPGGSSDVVVRALSEPLARDLARPIVAENKGGAGGLLAAAQVSRAEPDGSMVLYGNQGQIVVAPHLAPAAVDPRAALVPVVQTVRVSFLLVVPSESPFRSAAELTAAARARTLRFGVPGIGSPPHMATVLLNERARTSIDIVPYQGSAPMLVDLIAGRLDGAFDNVASSLSQVRAGKLRALGVSSGRRSAAAQGVPTLAEAGVDGFAYQSWHGLLAPKASDPQFVASLADAVRRALNEPALRTRLEDAGFDVVASSSPAEFKSLIDHDSDEWLPIVRKGALRGA